MLERKLSQFRPFKKEKRIEHIAHKCQKSLQIFFKTDLRYFYTLAELFVDTLCGFEIEKNIYPFNQNFITLGFSKVRKKFTALLRSIRRVFNFYPYKYKVLI